MAALSLCRVPMFLAERIGRCVFECSWAGLPLGPNVTVSVCQSQNKTLILVPLL